MSNRFIRALKGETIWPPPVWLMRQAGRYLPEYRELRATAGGFLAMVYDPDYATEITLQPIRRFGFDAAILFSDILVLPQALGRRLWFVEGEGPRLDPLRDPADIPTFDGARVSEHCAPIYETVRRLSRELSQETALIGFAGAPFTVAAYMIEGQGSREFAAAKGFAFRESTAFARLLEVLADATAVYLKDQIAAGAQAVQLFESWAGVVPASHFEDWVVKPTRRIVDQVHASYPDIPVIGFPRQSGILIERYAADTGIAAVGMDPQIDTAWAAKHLQPKLTVQGNLDPVLLLTGGEPMLTQARRIAADLSGGPFVFNLGHGVIKETPPEHVTHLLEHIRTKPANG